MNNYNEYIEERLYGMYNILESSKVLMETTKQKGMKHQFMKFMEGEGKKDELHKDIENAKSKEQKIKVAKKYEKDVAKWLKETGIDAAKAAGLTATIMAAGKLEFGLYATVFIGTIGWGFILRASKAAADHYKK